MFYRIEDRMAKDLKLSCNELLIYGVIYSSQYQTYTRGQEHLAEITWAWLRTVKRILKSFIEKWLLVKVPKWYQIVPNWHFEVPNWHEEESAILTPDSANMTPKKCQNDTLYINNKITKIEEEKKEEKKSTTTRTQKKKDTTPSVNEILEKFKEHTWIKNEQAIGSIKVWLEYKQGSKHKYKTIQWAITQIQKVLWLLGEKDRVKKLEFCVNNSIANNWQWLGWYDSSEKEFYAWLRQEQKIKKEEEPIKWGWGYGSETIDSIINQVVEEQIKQGIIMEL